MNEAVVPDMLVRVECASSSYWIIGVNLLFGLFGIPVGGVPVFRPVCFSSFPVCTEAWVIEPENCTARLSGGCSGFSEQPRQPNNKNTPKTIFLMVRYEHALRS